MTNLLRSPWTELNPVELRLFSDERIGGPGQYSGRAEAPDKFYLHLAGTLR